MFKNNCLFSESCFPISGQVRTGRRTLGFPSQDLSSVPAKPRPRRSLGARVWSGSNAASRSGLNATFLPGLSETWTRGRHRSSALHRDAAGLTGTSARLQPALSPGFRFCPHPCVGEGVKCLSPLSGDPSPPWAIPPVFSSQDPDAFSADAELVPQDALIHLRGGLTPSRGSFPGC